METSKSSGGGSLLAARQRSTTPSTVKPSVIFALSVASVAMAQAADVSSPLSAAAERVDFARDILPVFREACVECHGAEKQKGKLRMDTRGALLKGGEDGKVIEPGNAEMGDLLRRIALPEGDDDVMPPKGKAPHLSPQQIQRVKKWIADGAKWPDDVVIAPDMARTTGGKSARMNTAAPVPSAEEMRAIAALEKQGIKVRTIAAGVNWRHVNFRGAGDKISSEVFPLLGKITTLTELNLGGVALKDEDLASIAGLKNLEVLHLDSTPITDAALTHVGVLESLISLNLFGTAITDAGLSHLGGLRNLQSLYLAETKASAEGVARLQRELPKVQIETGAGLKDLAKKEPPVAVKPAEKK